MFGVNKDELLEGLENLRERICGYCGPTCDCKYGIEKIKSPIEKMQLSTSEQTGCPEIRQAIELVKSLSDDEFAKSMIKARIVLPGQLFADKQHI